MVGGRVVRIALVAVAAMSWSVLACDAATPVPTRPPAPVVDCLAAPPETCQQALGDAHANAPAGEWPLRVRVTCSQPRCTLETGIAQVDVFYSDGSVQSYGSAWDAAPRVADPGAILPLTPACIGVAFERCREMATNIIVPVGQTGRLVSIVVRCTIAQCTPTTGQGTTRVTFEDGTTRVADWGYAE